MRILLGIPFCVIIVLANTDSSSNEIADLSTVVNETNTGIDLRKIPFDFLSPESCRLRSKKFISNGLCTSPKPIGELVCAELCSMPAGTKSPYTFHLNSLRKRRSVNKNQRRNSTKWRCVETSTRKKKVKLICHDGTIRSYTLRLVTSCTCTPAAAKFLSSKKQEQKSIANSTTNLN